MVKLLKFDFAARRIYFNDTQGALNKYMPIEDQTHAGVSIFPINYWTLSYFDSIDTIYYDEELYRKTLGEFKNQWEKIQSLKLHNIDDAARIEKLAAQVKINKVSDELLYPYQKLDAKVMSERKSFLNLNCMRSGKTYTTCAALELMRQKNHDQKIILSIVQSTSQQWENALQLICPDYKIFNVTDIVLKKKRSEIYQAYFEENGSAILISNRDKLKSDIATTAKSKTAIVSLKQIQNLSFGFVTDEVHFVRKTTTKQSRIHFTLSKLAMFRWGLTGTKISNHPIDLYGILKFLHPKAYANSTNFKDRYLVKSFIYLGRYKKIPEYKEIREDTKTELMGLIYWDSIERTEEEVLAWAPKMQELDPILLPMEHQQQKIYDETLIKLKEEWKEENAYEKGLALRTALLQIASTAKSIEENYEVLSNKEQWLFEWLEENEDYHVKPVIFGRFSNKTLAPLVAKLQNLKMKNKNRNYRVGFINGTVESKSQIASDWQKGKFDILVSSIKAGGTGLTLDYGDSVIFYEREDNLADNLQAEKRIQNTRKDDLRIKQIIHLVSNGVANADLVQFAQQKQKQDWLLQLHPDEMTKQLLAFEQRKKIFILKGLDDD